MKRDDRLTDAHDLGLDDDDAAALVDGTASWQYAAGIFARLVATAAVDDPGAYDGFPPDTRVRKARYPGEPLLDRCYSIEGMHGPLSREDHLIERYLDDETTALGRLYQAYTEAADLRGIDALWWLDVLQPALREAAELPEPAPLGQEAS